MPWPWTGIKTNSFGRYGSRFRLQVPAVELYVMRLDVSDCHQDKTAGRQWHFSPDFWPTSVPVDENYLVETQVKGYGCDSPGSVVVSLPGCQFRGLHVEVQ